MLHGVNLIMAAGVLGAQCYCKARWCQTLADGTSKHAMIGLVGNLSGSGLSMQLGQVEKYSGNPLFQQDKPWEPRLDNGYPNVVYDDVSAQNGDGPWRLWYGGLGDGEAEGQYLYYANSTDGLHWTKPNLNRYDVNEKWGKEPWAKAVGKKNNIIMYGGGLGIYHDLHDPDPSQRYKISGGSPAGCYSDDGSSDCAVATAGSPDGIHNWSHVTPLTFPAPWRPDCHTNLFYDDRHDEYRMTTRDYTSSSGRDISIALSGGGGSAPRHWTGNWTLMYNNTYPPTEEASGAGCTHLSVGPTDDAAAACGLHCRTVDNCAFFWVYTTGRSRGTCCPKASIDPGKLMRPACPTCGGKFFKMDGQPVMPPSPSPGNASVFGNWKEPVIVETGVEAHQLYSQITFPFYDIYLGIVMVFDATNGNVGPAAGHVHCRLSWSADGLTNWQWVDSRSALSHNSSTVPEFIPAGPIGSFESHVCFAAHLPMKMPDGTIRLYYMGGNGPHSGQRNTSFALATLKPDGFAGVGGSNGVTSTAPVLVTAATMIVTADVLPGGSITISVIGANLNAPPITTNVTDHVIQFSGSGLQPYVGKSVSFNFKVEDGVVYTLGFMSTNPPN